MARGLARLGRILRPEPRALERLDFATERRIALRVAVDREAVLSWTERLDERQVTVRIFDRSPDGLGLYLPQQLPVGQLTKVRWEGAPAIQTVVRHCRLDDEQFAAGLMHLPVQRRANDRKAVRKPAKLYWDDLFAGRLASAIELRDVSRDGLCCHSPRSVPVPLLVCLATADWHYYGTTRYCARSESGYLVGIQIVRAELAEEPGLLLR
jgi:hypothetical protein